MENNNPTGITLQKVLSTPGFQPGDVSHLDGYEDMVHQIANFIKSGAEGMIKSIPDEHLRQELKLPEKCLGEEMAIKAIQAGQLYFNPELKDTNREYPGRVADHHGFNVEAVRNDFPVLHQRVHGDKPLVWLDNAATSQKPNQVIDAISDYYRNYNSNIHRGAHELAARATDAYELARQKVQHFMGAASDKEIIYVRGTTEGINLIAQTYGKMHIEHGDEIILSASSHHANIVPWQMLANEKRAHLRIIPFNDAGELDLEVYKSLLTPKAKIVAVDHVSNVLGTVNPIQEMCAMAHANNSIVVVDGAQAAPHIRPNVQVLDCDFYVFSGHKIFAPTGIGIVYGKTKHLDTIPPYQGGGNMINHVTFEHTTYNPPPTKFEAGTGNIADAIGLGAALDYIQEIGFDAAGHYEKELVDYGMTKLSMIPDLFLIGTSPGKVGVMSFVVDGVSNEEMGKYLDRQGIAVRSGHHCAQPALAHYGMDSSVRPSVAFYNTFAEIDYLVDCVKEGITQLKA